MKKVPISYLLLLVSMALWAGGKKKEVSYSFIQFPELFALNDHLEKNDLGRFSGSQLAQELAGNKVSVRGIRFLIEGMTARGEWTFSRTQELERKKLKKKLEKALLEFPVQEGNDQE